jgi:hypothetical protein
MPPMITSRIKPSAFFRDQPATDLFVQEHRQAKLGSYVANLAATDGLIDLGAVSVRLMRPVRVQTAAKAVSRLASPRSWYSCRRCTT